MYRSLFLILLTGILAYCFSQDTQSFSQSSLLADYKEADKLYTNAEKLSVAEGAKAKDIYQLSLIQLDQLIPKSKSAGYDSLTFFLHLKVAAINYRLDSTADATKNYLAAITIKDRLPGIGDSLLFIPFLNTGRIYHSENMFDSANLFYKKAERINEKYRMPLKESQLLFDRLGILYNEIGHYNVSRNYLEKAITLLPANTPARNSELVGYKMNIAAMGFALEEYNLAQQVYESLIAMNVYNNEINLNLGIIKLKQENYPAALNFFKKVNSQSKTAIELYYNYGKAYSGLANADSADLYFHKALAENLKWNGHRSNLGYGMILKYQADELVRQEKLNESLVLYQQALSQFDNKFNEKEINKNPSQYGGIFSYANLFNTLVAKAISLEQLHHEKKNNNLLDITLQTYESAFQLVNYVARTYNSDECWVFLSKIKSTVQGRPIEIAMQLYQLTNQRRYLESVYFFDQQNKTIALLLATKQNIGANNGSPFQELLKKENTFKSNITRLSLKAMSVTDSSQFSNLSTIIKNNETELAIIQKELADNSEWQQRRTTAQIPTVSELQKNLDNTSAFLSFHLTESDLLTLFISSSQFEFRKIPINKKFFNNIKAFRSALQNTKQDQLYSGSAVALELYNNIINPLKHRLTRINRLIIIPDEEFHNIPMEALQDEHGNYLIEKFAIQYQYSSALLGENISDRYSTTALAFAPFAGGTATDSSGATLTSLPASKDEIDKLEGKIFIDTAATKKNFLENINHYGILHLASHTNINNEDPLKTFVAFNPINDDNKLEEREILDLNMDSTNLIILSASKLNPAKKQGANGLISLSRAFAHAGCPNLISSLWKGEDKVTALVTQRLHYYLDQKYSKDKALQQAKLDLLRSNEIEPELKSPNHWAQLVFIGNYQPNHEKNNWWWVAVGIIIILLSFYLFKKRK